MQQYRLSGMEIQVILSMPVCQKLRRPCLKSLRMKITETLSRSDHRYCRSREALFIAIQSLVDDGDRVLLTDPGFVSYEACIRLAGGRPDFVSLKDDLHINEEMLYEKMDGARLLILNSPNNPTGAVESRRPSVR